MNKKNFSLDGEIIMYQPEGAIQLPVRVENETVWLTIDQMAHLFGKSRSTINEHILNALSEGEIIKNESVRKIGNSDFSPNVLLTSSIKMTAFSVLNLVTKDQLLALVK